MAHIRHALYVILISIAGITNCFSSVEKCNKFESGSNKMEFHIHSKKSMEIRDLKIFYIDDADDCLPTNETYLLTIENGYPKIIYMLEGHSVDFAQENMDEEPTPELLVYYNSGGNLYNLLIFQFRDSSFRLLDGDAIVSNLRDIKIENKTIIANYIYIINGEQKIVTSHFKVSSGKVLRLSN